MKRLLIGSIFAILFENSAYAFDLTSADVANGRAMSIVQVYKGFGCNGENLSPTLVWKDSPAATRSFAITVFDPDAPTSSGWWHWVVYDIPATATSLPAGAAIKTALPEGAKQGRNDFGERNYGGACPPTGDKPHRYVFTVYALKVERLGVPEDASPALISYMLNGNSLGKAELIATYSKAQ